MTESEIILRIKRKLCEIEEKEQVRIIHCVESGSRAWGFASPDSDFDVRFIYIRKPEFYLRLDKTRDVIEWELDDVYDINGWDLQKALRLLHKSNPTLFEWNSSPIVYKTTEDYDFLRETISDFFLAKSGLYHYLSTAKHQYKIYLQGEQVKLKKYFYVLRPILACKWILERNTPPPMLFSELMDAELEADMKPTVEKLLEMKMNTSEMGTDKRIDMLNDYIDDQIEQIQQRLDSMDRDLPQDWNRLNDIFLKMLYRKEF